MKEDFRSIDIGRNESVEFAFDVTTGESLDFSATFSLCFNLPRRELGEPLSADIFCWAKAKGIVELGTVSDVAAASEPRIGMNWLTFERR